MRTNGLGVLMTGVALVALSVPVSAATQPQAKRVAAKKKPKVTFEENDRFGALSSFTPSIVDPARAARAGIQTSERSFRFTPSGRTGDRKALTLGLSTRVVTAPSADPIRIASAAGRETAGYKINASVGYQGFALSGGFSQLDALYGPRREGVDLGLSYRGKRWRTSLQAAAEQPSRAQLDPLGLDKRYSVELGGAYSLNSRLSLQAGARYQFISPLDPVQQRFEDDRGDPAVYLGTAFRF